MKSNNNTPAIRFAGFTGDWRCRTLGEMGKARSGVGFPDSEQGGKQGIPFFKVSDMNNIGNATEMCFANNYVTKEQIDSHHWDPIKDLPAIFFAKVGAAVLQNRKRLCTSPFLMDNNTMAYSLDASVWDANFSRALFDTIDLTALIQVGALPSYNAKDVGAVAVFLPEKAEQRQLGHFYDSLEALITLHQKKYEKLVNLKKAMLDKMFPKNGELVPEVRFAGFSGNWERRKLGEVGKAYAGLTGKSKNDFGHGAGKYITYMNVFSNPVTSDQGLDSIEVDDKQNDVRYGDVFFTTSSETPEEVGMTSVCLSCFSNTYLNSFCFGYRLDGIEINLKYLAYFLRSPIFRSKMIRLAQGISRYNISKSKVMELPLFLPPLEEQQMIGESFSHLDFLILGQAEKINRLSKLKTAFLAKMFV